MAVFVLALLLNTVPATANHAPGHQCDYVGGGIICHWTGETARATSSATARPRPARPPGGPWLRLGAHAGGSCWYWAFSPPGVDSSRLINEGTLIAIISSNPPCAGTDVVAEAWEVFRSFPLVAPEVEVSPEVGVTGLDSYLAAPGPQPIDWSGILPSGVPARVEAFVMDVAVDWGDGTLRGHRLQDLGGYPNGSATHLYTLKTCSPEYRSTHPSGRNCHPSLEAYPITVTFRWFGRVRTGGAWVGLGILNRTSTILYDVDEVVGVLQ